MQRKCNNSITKRRRNRKVQVQTREQIEVPAETDHGSTGGHYLMMQHAHTERVTDTPTQQYGVQRDWRSAAASLTPTCRTVHDGSRHAPHARGVRKAPVASAGTARGPCEDCCPRSRGGPSARVAVTWSRSRIRRCTSEWRRSGQG